MSLKNLFAKNKIAEQQRDNVAKILESDGKLHSFSYNTEFGMEADKFVETDDKRAASRIHTRDGKQSSSTYWKDGHCVYATRNIFGKEVPITRLYQLFENINSVFPTQAEAKTAHYAITPR